MPRKSKVLVAVLGGRPLRQAPVMKFLPKSARQKIKDLGFGFIVATNNHEAAEDYRQIPDIEVVEASDEFKASFRARRKEIKDNLGAETRELINCYAIEHGYDYSIQLDDNIITVSLVDSNGHYVDFFNDSEVMVSVFELFAKLMDHTNAGAIGMKMTSFPPSKSKHMYGVSFPYSFFIQRVDPNFHFSNSTEDDILMSFYNHTHGKPSITLRCLAYRKTSNKKDKTGNRKMYDEIMGHRGDYCQSLYPQYYSKSLKITNRNCTNRKVDLKPRFKHQLRVLPEWRAALQCDPQFDATLHDWLAEARKKFIEKC